MRRYTWRKWWAGGIGGRRPMLERLLVFAGLRYGVAKMRRVLPEHVIITSAATARHKNTRRVIARAVFTVAVSARRACVMPPACCALHAVYDTKYG